MASSRNPEHNGASPSFSMNPILDRDQSQWLFTVSDLLRSPSILEGMSGTQELANRQKGVNFITQVGIMLKLPQLTLATASVFLHRFFMRHAMALPNKPGLHHYSVAATALFLATKVEENCRKMRELVVACCRVAQKQPNLVVDEQSKEYWKWRDTILHNEDLLLEALCFDLQLEQPYRILFEFLQYYGVQDNKPLRNTSWAFLNDSHVTTMCLLHSPRMIAGSALYAGARLAGVTLPDDHQGRPWWEQLDLDVLEIQKACNLMFEVYENPALPRVGQKDAYSKEDDIAMFDRTRQILTPRPDASPSHSVRSGSVGVKRERDEEQQSDEWGSVSARPKPPPTEPQPPSPKRQRRESEEDTKGPPAGSRIPLAANGGRPEGRKDGVDDVQQRIDDIINASNSNSGSYPPSTLTRRTSDRQQWQGPPPRRRSDATTNWQRPPSPNSNGHVENTEREQSHVRRPGRDPGSSGDDVQPSRPVKVAQSDQLQQDPPSGYTAMNDIDDAEKVDYGSEEGEL